MIKNPDKKQNFIKKAIKNAKMDNFCFFTKIPLFKTK